MLIQSQEELFGGVINLRYITERGIKVSKLFSKDGLKAIFHGEVKRKGEEIEILGKFFIEKKMECARCLDEFLFSAEEEVFLVLKPASSLPRSERIELKMGDLDEDFFESPEIDFYDYMIHLAELFIPQISFCKPDCKGICKNCGENLNSGNCSCSNR
jgi:uncharacterized protein